MDTRFFFPVGEDTDAARVAKDVCSRCPVQIYCLEFALVTTQSSGIWGGLSEDERRVLKRARRRQIRK